MAGNQYGFGGGPAALPVLDAAFMARSYDLSIAAAQVSNITTSEQTFTLTGLTTGDAVFVTKPTHQAGLGVVNARVSATDTLAITYMNVTGSGITPTTETYKVVAVRVAA